MIVEASEIEALARECIAEDWDDHVPGYYRNMNIERFASLVEAAAMERAAKLCEAHAREAQMVVFTRITDSPREVISRECAETIRAAIPGSAATA
jgi:hypothetical protein